MKNLLIITYYWPPSGGGGVQRVVKFARYLREFGWNPLVLTVQKGKFPSIDTSFQEEAADLEVFYAGHPFTGKTNNPHAPAAAGNGPATRLKGFLNRVKQFTRINFLVPDARIFWYSNALRKAGEILETLPVQLIFSTSPPYTAQLVGLKLKRRFDLPWVVDFRDPWVENIYYNTTWRNPLARFVNQSMEQRVLFAADRIITVGDQLRQILEHKTRAPVTVIGNGYDPADFPALSGQPAKFIIGYYGSLNRFQVPPAFLQSLAHIKTSLPGVSRDLELHVAGNNQPDALRLITSVFPRDRLRVYGSLPHRRLVERLCTPQVLLQLIHQQKDNRVIVGGKLYEYIHTGNPILCLGNTGSDGARLVEETRTGRAFEFHDAAGIRQFILQCHQKWKNLQLNTGKKTFADHERKNLARRLAAVFDSLAP